MGAQNENALKSITFDKNTSMGAVAVADKNTSMGKFAANIQNEAPEASAESESQEESSTEQSTQ